MKCVCGRGRRPRTYVCWLARCLYLPQQDLTTACAAPWSLWQVNQYEEELARELYCQLAGLPGATILGPPPDVPMVGRAGRVWGWWCRDSGRTAPLSARVVLSGAPWVREDCLVCLHKQSREVRLVGVRVTRTAGFLLRLPRAEPAWPPST